MTLSLDMASFYLIPNEISSMFLKSFTIFLFCAVKDPPNFYFRTKKTSTIFKLSHSETHLLMTWKRFGCKLYGKRTFSVLSSIYRNNNL